MRFFEAKRLKLTRYDGKPCLKCGMVERLVSNRSCPKCKKGHQSLEKRRVRYNRSEFKERYRQRRINKRIKALQLVMLAHGVQGCHFGIHPNMPISLKKHPCWGKLTFEHPNGGGRQIRKSPGSGVVLDILSNRVEAKDLMVLCQLHQIWNLGA
jgi:hypothetical protein